MEDARSEEPEDFAEMYLSSLPSMKFYNDVKRNYSDLSNYSKQCEKLTVKNDNDEMKTVCRNFVRHIEKSDVWNVSNPQYDFCLLLNYWIYDRLTHIFVDKDNSDLAFSNFQYIWSYPEQYIKKNTSHTKKCKYEIDVRKHEDWKKRKEFYDYCIDYDTLNGLVNFSDKCNDFYEYIERKEEIYKYFQNLCVEEPTKCPEFYEECKQHNPNVLLSKLSCHDEMVRKKAAAEPQALLQETESRPSLGSDDPEHVDGSGTAPTQENSNIETKVGHSVLGVAPVLLTATALYRYTPVGSWIRKLGGYNQSGISDMDGFSSYTQESGDMFSDSEANYISYQPI
ncbi:PIR protein [Plasmodium ovale]|uniref:PIR Superfamily Protein n=2 Tax=Plasmodium ovale TaxID=36330 RepID=A0A1A8XC17_PLAOA|nr:PIR Superfamily Protein [Plasmodium ovale curtisi]SBT02738.1 PIR Superfamily Protein [Plasmodium ovale curtisi]SBT83930.1 PIR protein [Plasmodium ovale]